MGTTPVARPVAGAVETTPVARPAAGSVDTIPIFRPAAGDVETTPVTRPSAGPFELKLYWERGYTWQEERFERKWCMKCRTRASSCAINHQIHIVDCDRERPTSFVFRETGILGSQIQVAGSTLCLERNGPSDIRLRRCRDTTPQLWAAPRGGFATRRFEIAPVNDSSLCMTQRHHPKRGEIVQLEPCAQARGDATSFWNRY